MLTMGEQWECIYAYSTFLRESLKVIVSLVFEECNDVQAFLFLDDVQLA